MAPNVITRMKHPFEDRIVAELIKNGWCVDPKDNPYVVLARCLVKTFRGYEPVTIQALRAFESGVVSVQAEFVTRGENALSACYAFIKNEDEILSQMALFHNRFIYWLPQAFTVRVGHKDNHPFNHALHGML